MERGNMNVIIFEEDEPSIKEHQESRTGMSSKQLEAPRNHHIEIIEQEIQYLTDKIKSLEQQADSLAQLKNESNANHRFSTTSMEIPSGHSREVVIAIQKKIQIIVRETRRIVDKLGETFDKKLSNKIEKKYDECGITKMKQNYSSAIGKIEENYRKEIDRINRQHKDQESRMISRVSTLEQNIVNRMNQFQIKEKEYVDWIHHLEIQLQDKPKEQKTKKMIEITHAASVAPDRISKKQTQINSSMMTGDNCSGFQPQKSNSSQIQESSKIQRRHRIFDGIGAKTSASVSPNTKIVNSTSPSSAQPGAHTHSSKIINPITNRPQVESQPRRPQPENPQNRQTEVSYQAQKPGLVIERMTEPLKNNYTNQRQSSPWKVMDTCSVEKSHEGITKRKEIAKDVNASQFYKDIPKANQGWEGFQSYQQNEESSSDSEEDVIFYRNEDPREDWPSNKDSKWKTSKEEKAYDPGSKRTAFQPEEQRVFSPFDLN